MRQGELARSAGLLGIAAMLLVACSPSHEEAGGNDAANVAATRFADRMAGTPPPAPPAKPFKQTDKSALLEFAYAYPAQAAAIPALVDKFDKQLTTSKADALKMAKDDSASAKQADYPFRAHSLERMERVGGHAAFPGAPVANLCLYRRRTRHDRL